MQVRYQAALRPDRTAIISVRRLHRSGNGPQQLANGFQLVPQRRRRCEWRCDNAREARSSARSGTRLRGLGFETMARAVDRESLLVEKIADATDQQDFVVLVIAPIATALDRLQLREFLFPIAKHMRLHRAQLAHLANREIPLGGDWGQLGLSSVWIRHGSSLRPSPSVSGSREMSR